MLAQEDAAKRRLLGVDFGEARIGLAISAPSGEYALPLPAITRQNDRQAVEALASIATEHEATAFVLGEPRLGDGSRGEMAARVRRFADKLAAASGLPVEMVDEHLTTREARRLAPAGAATPRSRVDSLAAKLLLEDYLEKRRAR